VLHFGGCSRKGSTVTCLAEKQRLPVSACGYGRDAERRRATAGRAACDAPSAAKLLPPSAGPPNAGSGASSA
jgi:hypothetical protein